MIAAETPAPEPVVNIRALRLGDVIDVSQLGDAETLIRLLEDYGAKPPKVRRARASSGGGEI